MFIAKLKWKIIHTFFWRWNFLLFKWNASLEYLLELIRDPIKCFDDALTVGTLVENFNLLKGGYSEPKGESKKDATLDVSCSKDSRWKGVKPHVREVNEVSLKSTCKNCNSSGHLFRNCTLPRKQKFCYVCVKKGVIA